MKLAINELMWCARAAGFIGNDIIVAGAVAMSESGGDPEVIGIAIKTRPDGTKYYDNQDLGAWQVSAKWHSAKVMVEAGANWRDPTVNAKLAKLVFDERAKTGQVGWAAWAVYESGAYKQWLPLAEDQFKKGHLWEPPHREQVLELTATGTVRPA
jgi:hypothetical protein